MHQKKKVLSELEKEPMIEPEKDVIDVETKEQKIQTLAAELDQLSQDIDPYGYADTVAEDRKSVV